MLIPVVDRAETDPRNLLGIIAAVDDHGMLAIVTEHGFVALKFSRNQFQLCYHRLVSQVGTPEEKRLHVLLLREAAVALSLGH